MGPLLVLRRLPRHPLPPMIRAVLLLALVVVVVMVVAVAGVRLVVLLTALAGRPVRLRLPRLGSTLYWAGWWCCVCWAGWCGLYTRGVG